MTATPPEAAAPTLAASLPYEVLRRAAPEDRLELFSELMARGPVHRRAMNHLLVSLRAGCRADEPGWEEYRELLRALPVLPSIRAELARGAVELYRRGVLSELSGPAREVFVGLMGEWTGSVEDLLTTAVALAGGRSGE